MIKKSLLYSLAENSFSFYSYTHRQKQWQSRSAIQLGYFVISWIYILSILCRQR